MLLRLPVGPGAAGLEGTGPHCWSPLPPAPSLAPGRPSRLPAQKLAKVLGFLHQAGSISLPGLRRGVSLSANRANHLPCSVWSDDCLPSLMWGLAGTPGLEEAWG